MSSRRAPNRWLPGEEEILKKLYPTGGPMAVHERLPHRPVGGIISKASRMGVAIYDPHKVVVR